MEGLLRAEDLVVKGVGIGVAGLVQRHAELGQVFDQVGVGGLIEELHELIEFLVLDRIIRVGVALHAAEADAHPCLPSGAHAVDDGGDAELLIIGAALAVDLGEAAESGGDLLVERRVRDQIAGDLFDGELVEWQVAVEGVDEPIAVFPDLAAAIVGVARAIGVAGEVHPDGGPALAEMRRCEQPVGFLFDGSLQVCGSGFLEDVEFVDGGRQSGEVERGAAQPLRGIGGGRWIQLLRFKAAEDEVIEAADRPIGFTNGRPRVVFRSDERPMLAPFRAFGDPLAEGGDLRGAERGTVLRLRHDLVRILGGDAGDHFRGIGFAGDDHRLAGLAFAESFVPIDE